MSAVASSLPLPPTLPSTTGSAVESAPSETMTAVLTTPVVTLAAEASPLSHPENTRDVSEQKAEKHVVFSHESSTEEIDSAEGELDDEADEDDDDDALVSTASFQNGDEVIISSASSVYNGERARIVDIRGDKLMLSVKDEQVVLTLDEVKSLNELTQDKNQLNKNVRTSARIRHQTQPMSPYHNQSDKQSSVRRNDRPKRDAAGNAFVNPKGGAAPRSRNNSKAMLGKRVAIVGGRNKGERGRVTKGANGYFTIVLERSSTNPSSNTQVMKRSHDLKVIDGSGDFPIPHRRANQNGWNKKNKSRAYDDTEDEMDEEKQYEDELSDEEEYESRATKRTAWANRSRSRSPFSSNSEMESEPLSESESSLIQSDDESESAARHSVKSKPVANIEREAAQILMDILQARANPQLLKRQYTEKAQTEPQIKRSRTFSYEEANQSHDANSTNQAMITEDYARVDAESRPNLNVVIGQEDHQFYTPLLSSTSTVASHHASPAIAPVLDESKLYPSSPFATLSAPLQLTSAQNSPSMKSLNAAAANASLLYQKSVTTPTHGVRTQFFPPTPRSPISKAMILPATPNGSCTPQAFTRVATTPVFQSFPSPMPAAQAVRASPTNLAFTINRPQMTILSTAASTVM